MSTDKRTLRCEAIVGLIWVASLLLILLTLSLHGCAPEAASAKDLKEADQAWEHVYGGMSVQEKMKGVVYE